MESAIPSFISCVGKALRRDVQGKRVGLQWPGEEGTRCFREMVEISLKRDCLLHFGKSWKDSPEVRTPGEQIHSNTGWETKRPALAA